MKNMIVTTVLATCVLLAIGCDRSRRNRRARAESRRREGTPTIATAEKCSDTSPPVAPTDTEEYRGASGNDAGIPSNTVDTEMLAPVGTAADRNAQTLGYVRRQLGELVEEAVRTKKALLQAKLDGEEHTTSTNQ